MVVLVCVLVNEVFDMANVWDEWAKGQEEHVLVIVGLTNKKDKDEDDVVKRWCARDPLCRHFVALAPAEWAEPSLLRAIIDLFDAAVTFYGFATHLWLVTEKTIPCLSAKALASFCRSPRMRNRSRLAPLQHRPKRSVDGQDPELDVWLKAHKFYSRDMLLCTEHWLRVKASTSQGLEHLEASGWPGDAVWPDESVIQTEILKLAQKGQASLEIGTVVKAFWKKDARALVLDDKFVTTRLPSILLGARATIPGTLGVRKFKREDEENIKQVLRKFSILE